MSQDPLSPWMELYFVAYQNPSANEDAGWRRYSGEAMMIDYRTRLTGEPIEHDLKQINEALRIRDDDPKTARIKALMAALPDAQYQAIFAKYWYQGGYYEGLLPDPEKGRDPVREFKDPDRARKVGQALRTYELNVKLARDVLYTGLGLKRKQPKAA